MMGRTKQQLHVKTGVYHEYAVNTRKGASTNQNAQFRNNFFLYERKQCQKMLEIGQRTVSHWSKLILRLINNEFENLELSGVISETKQIRHVKI